MKLPHICSLIVLAGSAVAEDAYLWTIDHGTVKYANSQASSISPETASSIIARRRGLLGDSDLINTEADVLREVKQYGGYQVPLHGATSDASPSKLLIRISGFTGTVSEFPSLPDLWIEDATQNLANDFKARSNVEGVCEYNLQIPLKTGVDLVYTYDPEGSSCKSMQEIKVQPAILALFSSVPKAEDVAKELNRLTRVLNHLAVTADLETTLLILPPVSKLQKAKLSRRAGVSEQPFEIKPAVSSSTSTGSSASATATQPAKSSSPLPKFVPLCYSSQESCDENTNSCSGHGKCYKAHNGCYKCKCGRTTVRENKDGSTKSVQWGGNACQKKDVSTEFLLFAGFGIVFTALIAGAMGAMYTMGSQELPSVIGAGVAGPKQK